jgi:hypothetical protein
MCHTNSRNPIANGLRDKFGIGTHVKSPNLLSRLTKDIYSPVFCQICHVPEYFLHIDAHQLLAAWPGCNGVGSA